MKLSTMTPFVFEKAAVVGSGEDSFCVSHLNNGLVALGVFDGCGGIGGRRYPAVNNRKGSYIGSRVTAHVFNDCINKDDFELDISISTQLENAIFKTLNAVNSKISDNNSVVIGGNLSKSLPTTVSIILAHENENDSLKCEYLWAGDSRGYFLDSDGLCQLTIDDIDKNAEDAFVNLREDGILTNVANGDKPFKIHQGSITFYSPTMLISATDGCFAYFLTPMDFEFVILDTLIKSHSPEEWKELLCAKINEVTGDDYTLAIACFNFKDFNELQRYYNHRRNFVYENFVKKQVSLDEPELFKLWEEYRPSYYRLQLNLE